MSIYAIRRTSSTGNGNGIGYQNWYWDRDEAMTAFDVQVADFPQAVVEVYELDVEHLITSTITDAIEGENDEVTADRIAVHDGAAPDNTEDVTWGELEYRPEGYFYIEQTKASTSEYWPYNVEPYNVGDINSEGQWRLVDGTTDVPMAIIRHTQFAFKVTINGYSQTEVFTNMKAAVIWSVTEFNG